MPQPFQPPPDEPNALVALKGGGGIAVRPPSGLPDGTAEAIARAIVDRFTGAEVPATLGPWNRASHVLYGDARATPTRDGGADLDLAWVLTDPSGAVERSIDVIEHLPPALPRPGLSADAARRLAGRTVGMLVPAVTNGPAGAKRPSGVVVWSVDGAPGDGALALKGAMEAVLRQHGVAVVAKSAEADVTVLGSVELGPPSKKTPSAPASQAITVRWSVFGADGAELGVATQNNEIPAGLLNHRWGDTALDVALAAWDGVGELLRLGDGAKSGAP